MDTIYFTMIPFLKSMSNYIKSKYFRIIRRYWDSCFTEDFVPAIVDI